MSIIVWKKDSVRIVRNDTDNYGLEYHNGTDLMNVDQWKFQERLQGWELDLIKDYIREQNKART